jgi:hypothetical protein
VRTIAAVLAGTLLLAACSEVTETDPLPWLRVKKIEDRATRYEYYVKHLGFVWTKLDEAATGNVVAIGGDAAVISTAQGLKLLRRGDDHGILACGSTRSTPAVLATAGVIDCFDVVAGPAPAIATQIRWRRISSAGEALVVEKLGVEAPDRLFIRAMASFYDAGNQPYFVTHRGDASQAPECALRWVAAGELQSVAAPPGMTRGECSDAAPWSKVLRRTLRNA